jgi:hypothetical protein
MIFDIATFRIKIQRHQAALLNFPQAFYEDFKDYQVDDCGRVRIDFTITIAPFDFFSLSSKKLVPRQNYLYFEKKRHFIIKSRSTIACINTVKKEMTLGFRSKRNTEKNNLILMGFVRLAVSLLAILKGGLPFHSSAIAFGDRGIAFSGPSGAGKSTIATLLDSPAMSSKTAQLLNDDFNVILPYGRMGYRIWSTPFTHSKTLKRCVKRGVDLRTIFFIEKSTTNKIEDLSFKNKYVLALGQIFIFPLSDFFGKKILDNAERLCRTVACRRLHFRNDGSIRSFLYRYAGGLK